MIVTFHLRFLFSSIPDYIHKFTMFGGKWIVVFFVVSAYTITQSILSKNAFSWKDYFKKRFIRIAPQYYLMLVLGFILIIFTQNSVDIFGLLLDFFRHLVFLNMNPVDITHQNTFLGVEWYVPIQFWIYSIVPIVILLKKKSFFFLPVILFFSIVLHFYPNLIYTYKGKEGFYWTMQNFVMFYVMGIYTQLLIRNNNEMTLDFLKKYIFGIILILCNIGYYLYVLNTRSERVYSLLLLVIIAYKVLQNYIINGKLFIKRKKIIHYVDTLLFLVLIGTYLKYVNNFYYLKNPLEFMGLWTIALLLFCVNRIYIVRLLLENKYIQFLGKISYGIYLSHYLIMTMVGYYIPTQNAFIRTIIIVPTVLFFSYVLERYISIINFIRIIRFSK